MIEQKKFIEFKSAAILTLVILFFSFLILFPFSFPTKAGTHSNNFWWIPFFYLAFLLSTVFQVYNLFLANYLGKDYLPSLRFVHAHSILLVCNLFAAIGLLYVVVAMFSILSFFIGLRTAFIDIMATGIWLFVNIITTISSLRLRRYLRLRYVQQQDWLENLGLEE